MPYDNTKLDLAVGKWITAKCSQEFGETYAGDLLASFESFCAETGAMKRSPGRVAFGSALGRRKFEKRKSCGLTYWLGLTLDAPPEISVPRENTKSDETLRMKAKQERAKQAKLDALAKKEERIKRLAEIKKRMKKETAKQVRSAGNLKPEVPAD